MNELIAMIEAVLFTAAEPVKLDDLTAATGHPAEDVQTALGDLATRLQGTGLRLAVHQSTWQLVTAPETARAVKHYLQTEAKSDLSRAAVETLAMVAYRGPITKGRLDELRGVSSDTMVRNLLARGLISEAGRSDEPGRPMQYRVSHRFLQHFGLGSLDELPPLTEADPHEA